MSMGTSSMPAGAPSPAAPARTRIPRQLAYVVRSVWSHPGNRGRRLRTLAGAARFQLRGRLLGRPTEIRLGERSRILAHLHVYGSSKAVYGNPPDWPEMEVWRRALEPGGLFVDVGANIGAYSILAAELGADVVALEPGTEALRHLRENVALNGYPVTVMAAAAGDRPGRSPFTSDRDLANRLVPGGDGGGEVTVPVVTIDSVVGDRRVAGLKIDVEGAERLVLEGAGRALRDRRIDLIQIEWNDCSERFFGEGRDRIARLLGSCGYELLRPTSEGVLVPVEEPALGADVFARPREGGEDS